MCRGGVELEQALASKGTPQAQDFGVAAAMSFVADQDRKSDEAHGDFCRVFGLQ